MNCITLDGELSYNNSIINLGADITNVLNSNAFKHLEIIGFSRPNSTDVVITLKQTPKLKEFIGVDGMNVIYDSVNMLLHISKEKSESISKEKSESISEEKSEPISKEKSEPINEDLNISLHFNKGDKLRDQQKGNYNITMSKNVDYILIIDETGSRIYINENEEHIIFENDIKTMTAVSRSKKAK